MEFSNILIFVADEDMFYYECTKSLTEEEKKSGPYLCTGYDLYVTREPCVM